MSDTARIERLPGMPGGEASRLFEDYVRGDTALDPFFGRRVRASADLAPPPREGSLLDEAGRRALVEALLSSPGRIGGSRAQDDAIAALADESTLAVVTGQQPGLFLGALLTLYKAVATIALARRLEAHYGRRVVPIFWLVAEDDDFSEISETRLIDAAGAAHAIAIDAAGDEKRTYASLRVGASLESAGARIAALLSADGADGAGGAEKMLAAAVLAAAREPTPVRAFARLLGTLLADRGLVILDPSDARIKALAAPFVRRELEQPLASSRGAREAGARLEALGYHAQIRIDEDRPALFEVQDGRRARIAVVEGRDGRAAASTALIETIAPGVLIRPAYQDYLLPTVAYVGGPAEVAYLAQLGETYERHGVPRPIVVPRLAAILAEPEVARFLDRGAPDLALLREAPARLSGDAAAPPPAEIAALQAPLEALDAALARLGATLAAQAPPSAAMVEGARAKIRREIERVTESAAKQLDREREAQRRRRARARERLFPDGRLQERVLSPLPLLARWPGLVDALVNAYDPLDARPLLVRLPGRSPNPPDSGGEALA